MNQPVRAEASASTRGTIYHLCVALERCFMLAPGQKLLIEELGDVTVPGTEQVEVKQYSSPLTDNHPNFWNTLFNWTDPSFDTSQYESLVLHTTQKFGERSKLAAWNSLDREKRIELLDEIHADLEADFQGKQKEQPSAPSKTLTQQRTLLTDRRSAVEAVVEKVVIEAGADGLTSLYKKLCETKAFHVLDSNAEKYINALLGFVCRLDMTAGERWEITREEFKSQVESLTNIYRSESRNFPRSHIDLMQISADCNERGDLFVEKIREIGSPVRHVNQAIRDFEGTVSTIANEFRTYSIAHTRLTSFTREIENLFEASYDRACLGTQPLDNKACQRFYLDTTTSQPPNFPGYDDCPSHFRNGLLHIGMDDEERDWRWRLEQ